MEISAGISGGNNGNFSSNGGKKSCVARIWRGLDSKLMKPLLTSRCEISGFCLLSFCQSEKSFWGKFEIIVNFIIQKLKNKHTFLKKYINWAMLSSLVLREQEETKTKYFAPKSTKFGGNFTGFLLTLCPFFNQWRPNGIRITHYRLFWMRMTHN